MKVLFDQNVPRALRRVTPDHSTKTTYEMTWGQIENGDLLNAAEKEGFHVLVTADKNIRYQQNLATRKIAIIQLSTPDWKVLKEAPTLYIAALSAATAGSYQVVQYALPPKPTFTPRGPSF